LLTGETTLMVVNEGSRNAQIDRIHGAVNADAMELSS
jgi:hypothetical protein